MASKESKRRKTRPDARSTPDPKNAGYLPGEGLPDYLRSAPGPALSFLGTPAILGAALVGIFRLLHGGGDARRHGPPLALAGRGGGCWHRVRGRSRGRCSPALKGRSEIAPLGAQDEAFAHRGFA